MLTLPTFNQLYNNAIADYNAEFGITIPSFGKNFLRAMAAVQAGRLWLYYKYLGAVQKNIFADTADSEAIGGTLERFGRVKLGRNPLPAVAGEYSLTVTGTVGAVIPGGTTFKSDDDSTNPGILYLLEADYTIIVGPNLISVRALTAGDAGRLVLGDTLTATAPISLVDPGAVVFSETVVPIEAEGIEDYRRKVLDSYRLEPQGGAAADYRLWASEAFGVLQSYPFAAAGPLNAVNLYIEATIADSIDGKGTPTPAILAGVESAIEDPTPSRPSRKPVTVTVNYLPVTPKDIDIEIAGFVGLTPAIETEIFNAIQAELEDVRPFVGAIDVLANKNDIYDVNRIVATILTAQPGSVFGAVTFTVDTLPFTSFTFLNGDIPFLNSITYV